MAPREDDVVCRLARFILIALALVTAWSQPLAVAPGVIADAAARPRAEREQGQDKRNERDRGDRAAENASRDAAGAVAIVVLADGADPVAAARSLGVKPIHLYRHVFTGFAAKFAAGATAAARRSPVIRGVTPDQPTSAVAQTLPTGVSRIGAPVLAKGNSQDRPRPVDADVAVLDSGVNPSRELNVAGAVTCQGGSRKDVNGHGTHVAGAIAARANAIGVVGVAPGARIWSVRVLGSDYTGFISDAICGLDWVYARRDTIDVVNMSLGGPGDVGQSCQASSYRLAVCRVVAAGIPVVVAAGNQGAPLGDFVPAAFPETIAVAAFADSDGQPGGRGGPLCRDGFADDALAWFSNYGQGVDIAAPGVCIISLGRRPNTTAEMSGTSAAAPHVAGALALFKAARPKASAKDARAWLLSDAASRPADSPEGISGDPGRLPPRVLFFQK